MRRGEVEACLRCRGWDEYGTPKLVVMLMAVQREGMNEAADGVLVPSASACGW